MTVSITEAANEKSTKIFTVTCTDENGDAVTPKTFKWTLSTRQNVVVNSRERVVPASLSSEINIVLSGDDLQIRKAESGLATITRYLVIEATYDSATLGNDIPLTEQIEFTVNNLKYLATTS